MEVCPRQRGYTIVESSDYQVVVTFSCHASTTCPADQRNRLALLHILYYCVYCSASYDGIDGQTRQWTSTIYLFSLQINYPHPALGGSEPNPARPDTLCVNRCQSTTSIQHIHNSNQQSVELLISATQEHNILRQQKMKCVEYFIFHQRNDCSTPTTSA